MPATLTYLLGTHPNASETFIQREIDALRRRGWTIDVASLRGASALRGPPRGIAHPSVGALAAVALRHALPLIFHLPRLPLQLLRHLPQAAALAQRIRDTHSAGVHAHFAHLPADISLLAARQTGVPYTCSVHAWDVFAQPPAAIRRRLQPAAAVFACSQAALDAVRAAGVEPSRMHLIRHGLPLPEYAFAPRRGGRHILAIGRLEPKKGFDLLIAACACLQATAPASPFTCRIIGDGSLRQRLEQQIRAQGLAEGPTVAANAGLGFRMDGRAGVFLTGSATPNEVHAALLAADVLVLPSRRLASGDRDGVANVLIEAMALGTPIVTTTAGAAGEVVRDGVNGRLVPPENVEALAAAIGSVLNDPAVGSTMACAARATVEAEFDEERTITQLEAALRPAS